jgi:integrase
MPLKNNNGSIRLYFTFNDTYYTMSRLGKFSDTTAIATAENILKAIQSDISIGKFACKDSKELFDAYHPLSNLINSQSKKTASVDCLELVEKQLASKILLDRNLKQTHNFLKRYGKPIKSSDDALKFWQWLQTESKGNNRTINRHLESLKPICSYFRDIPKLKVSQCKHKKPFTMDEISRIINAFETDFPHYTDFVKFLFATGCRPNEATAIRWSDIDFERNTISIREAIGIDKEGKKVSKDTKTGVVRTFPMSVKTAINLKSMPTWNFEVNPSTLVFRTTELCTIDIRTFRSRVWVKALELANVPYRKLYNTRHTFISHYIEKYKDYQKCAAITHGTTSGVETIIKHYSHLVNDIETLDLF